MPILVKIGGKPCLEIDLGKEGCGKTLGEVCQVFLLEPDLLLGDLAEFQRNTPILEKLAHELKKQVEAGFRKQQKAMLAATYPHLGLDPDAQDKDAGGDHPCCERIPETCVRFPALVGKDGSLYPKQEHRDPDLELTGEEFKQNSDLDVWIGKRLENRLKACQGAALVHQFLTLHLDPSKLELPGDTVLYAELPPQHLLFDPDEGPLIGRFGSNT